MNVQPDDFAVNVGSRRENSEKNLIVDKTLGYVFSLVVFVSVDDQNDFVLVIGWRPQQAVSLMAAEQAVLIGLEDG